MITIHSTWLNILKLILGSFMKEIVIVKMFGCMMIFVGGEAYFISCKTGKKYLNAIICYCAKWITFLSVFI